MKREDVIEYACKRRAFDGMWELIGKVPDPENAYTYISQDTKQPITITPTRWVTIDVSERKPRY